MEEKKTMNHLHVFRSYLLGIICLLIGFVVAEYRSQYYSSFYLYFFGLVWFWSFRKWVNVNWQKRVFLVAPYANGAYINSIRDCFRLVMANSNLVQLCISAIDSHACTLRSDRCVWRYNLRFRLRRLHSNSIRSRLNRSRRAARHLRLRSRRCTSRTS